VYRLEKNKPKGKCPYCNKPGKWRFFEGYHGNTNYGICDRINSCPSQGQIFYPDNSSKVLYVPPPAKPKVLLTIPSHEAKAIISKNNTMFHKFCYSIGVSKEHLLKWNVGGKDNFTIFVFENINHVFVNMKKGIYDIQGKLVKEDRNFKTQMNINDLSNGLYFVKAIVNSKIYSSKFIKG